MLTLGLIGLVGGVLAGISPCILPVLPVIFMSSAATSSAPPPVQPTRRDPTPFLVIAGLVTSFSVFTLVGALLLKALQLPSDAIRWTGLVLLLLLGIGMIVPAFERILEAPFSRISFGSGTGDRRGFVLGLALGAVYVPCAGPVLAAIVAAGATSKITGDTIVLTLSFALGTAIPLLAFALAGSRITQRIKAFRERQRAVRATGGVIVIALAIALSFNLTDAIQRLVPDYTASLSSEAATAATIRDIVGGSGEGLGACAQAPSDSLSNCGRAPQVNGVSSWFNTTDNKPITAADLKGKVVLVDFWAYSCINCQRAIPHVEAWYQRYHDAGLEVIGVHTPEYAFEYDRGNVIAGAKRLGITYPVALDNDYTTWNNFSNDSWPAEYLIDSQGYVRHVSIGEGDYGGTERLIRRLLSDATPSTKLAPLTQVPDTTPNHDQSQETYLGSERGQFYAGQPGLTNGTHDFRFVNRIAANQFTLRGTWTVGPEHLTAGPKATLAQAFTGEKVYLDVGGTGTLKVQVAGRTKIIQVGGAPDIYTVIDLKRVASGVVLVDVSPGLQVYSFTFG